MKKEQKQECDANLAFNNQFLFFLQQLTIYTCTHTHVIIVFRSGAPHDPPPVKGNETVDHLAVTLRRPDGSAEA